MSSQVRDSNRCLLCNEVRELTGEHVFADWMAKYIPKRHANTKATLLTSAGFRESTYPGDHRARTLDVLCAECNSRWGSNLQSKTKPILSRLVAGDWWAMSTREREQLARWVTSFIFVRECEHPELMVATPAIRTRFRNTGAVPKSVAVWMATFDAQERELASWQRAIAMRRDDGSFSRDVKLTVIALPTVLIFGLFATNAELLGAGKVLRIALEQCLLARGLTRIWPATRMDAHRRPPLESELYEVLIPELHAAIHDPVPWLFPSNPIREG